jgi:hypothetical protein
VETCTDLTKADWQVICEHIAGTGHPIRVTDFAAATATPQGFYRGRLKSP